MAQINTEQLAQMINAVDEALQAHRRTNDGEGTRLQWHDRADTANRALLAELRLAAQAEFKRRGNDYVVQLGGFSAVSTGGWPSALGNWKRGAEKRIAAAAGQVLS